MKFIAIIIMLFASVVQANEIRVAGQGVVSVKPDNAIINLHVSTTDKDMKTAVEMNAKNTTTFVATVKKLKVEDFITNDFNVNKNYNRTDPDKLVSYTATHRMSVVIKDIAKVGEVISGIGNTAQIENMSFIVSDSLRKKSSDEARKLAIEDATNRAKIFGDAAGLKVEEVKDISESNVFVPRMDKSDMAEVRSAVPTFAGNSKISVSITVTFSAKPAKAIYFR